MNNKIFILFVFTFSLFTIHAQDIPQHISYTRIYDFVDELANDGIIELNSAIRPYSRAFICEKLLEANSQLELLNKRQTNELRFFLNEYALEQDKLPDTYLNIWKNDNFSLAGIQPAFHYRDENFRARITPILGMHITKNSSGNIIERWYGAEFQGMIGKNLSVYGSLRDKSINGALLSKPNYLNDYQGYEYKESTKGGDYSDSRGGIKYSWKFGSIGLIKDNVMWGDNYHGSNILSGRAPSFPMVSLRLKPAKWFELNYFHGWLVSNRTDSTHFYNDYEGKRKYRMANKFMAANMFTFTPVRHLNLSVGNSIIYSENSVYPAYFIPIAFYKSIDHTLTKGAKLENQNSQLFFNFSSRNIKHLHLYTSVFIDEVKFSRFKPSSVSKNPISYKIGANLTNFPIENLSFIGEFTRTNIMNYKHTMPVLTWASNNYNLGHYLGDNSQEIYLALKYKPIRGLDLNLSFVDAKHGKDYNAFGGGNAAGIAQPSLGKIIWSNQTVGLKAVYEIINNGYAIINIENSNIQGFENDDAAIVTEHKMTAQEVLDYFTPKYLQGKKTTVTIGFSFGF